MVKVKNSLKLFMNRIMGRENAKPSSLEDMTATTTGEKEDLKWPELIDDLDKFGAGLHGRSGRYNRKDSYMIYHGTVPEKLPDIAKEGLKAFLEPGEREPYIFGTGYPDIAVEHVERHGPHDEYPDLNSQFSRTPVVVEIRMPKDWVMKQPDAIRPFYKEPGYYNPRCVDVFEEALEERVHDSSGVPLPVKQVPPEFIFVTTNGKPAIPLKDYLAQRSETVKNPKTHGHF